MAKDHLLLPNGAEKEPVLISSIQYIESDRKLCKVITAERTYIIIASLRSLAGDLPSTHFLRIHKRYVVSVSHVSSIGKNAVTVAGKLLPFAPRHRSELYEMYYRYRGRK